MANLYVKIDDKLMRQLKSKAGADGNKMGKAVEEALKKYVK